MTKIKFCGIRRMEDINMVNRLMPEYIGFVFAAKSKRRVSMEQVVQWRTVLAEGIQTVGVFVDESVEQVASLLNENVIDIAQLHGDEDEDYINRLKALCKKPVIKAFRMDRVSDLAAIETSSADYVLIDSGAGSGQVFDWNLIKAIKRPFFLAGGLDEANVSEAINEIHPFAVDVSSGIETDGVKDEEKMKAFVFKVRNQMK